MALWWVYARKGFVILSGPTERQVKQILFRELRRAFAVAPDLPGELYSMELRVTEDTGIIGFTSDNADRLTGFHHPRLLVCFTEAQGIADESFEAAMACCTGPENRFFVYGNPTSINTKFHQAATGGSWSVLTISALEFPNVVSGEEEIPGGASRGWIADMADEWGVNSSIYRSRVLSIFPEENIESLFKRSWIRAAFDRWESKELEAASWNWKPLIAVDVARQGLDSTSLAVCRGPVVEEIVTWRIPDLTVTVDKILSHAERLTVHHVNPKFAHLSGRPRLVIDDAGVGGGCTDGLRRKGWGDVLAFNSSNKAPDPRRFLNMRAAAHWRLRELLENNKVALPRDAMLEEELLAIEWQLDKKDAIQIVSKDLIRKTLGRSPDRADSVIMGLAHSVGNLGHHTVHISTMYR
jgi:hypothetical protein